MAITRHAFMIDYQVDFCDRDKGSLYVKGAEDDIKNAVKIIKKLGADLTNITLTLDSHHILHIANPLATIDSKGNHPAPFTQITDPAVKAGQWGSSKPQLRKWYREYVEKLGSFTVWPPHCLIGTPGQCIDPVLYSAVQEWETKTIRVANKIVKGSNIKTEHYGALMAEIPDPEDPLTQLNVPMIESADRSDEVLLMGEAKSHCLKRTAEQFFDNFDPAHLGKFIFISDATSSVPGFEAAGESFVENLKKRGIKILTTQEYLG